MRGIRDLYEINRIKLKVVTPVFIGGGSDGVVNKSKYIFNPGEEKIHFIDETKWADFLGRNNLVDDYMRYVRNSFSFKTNKNSVNLDRWLQGKGISRNRIREFIKYSLDLGEYDRKILNDINCFIKGPDQKPYIPGSSIKGAIRTAVLFWYIKSNRSKFMSDWNKIKRIALFSKKGFVWDIGKILRSIEERILCRSSAFQSGNRTIKDIFRGVSVSDSETIETENLILLQKTDLSTYTKNGNNLKKLPLFREYLKPETEAMFSITVDRQFLDNFQLKSVKDLLGCMQFMRDSIVESGVYDIFYKYGDFSLKEIESIEYPLNIGGGAGFHSKTVLSALAANRNDAEEVIKCLLDKNFWRHRHLALDRETSPRTLKLSKTDSTRRIVGWCSLEVMSN